ncbi:HXXEE domain-containing protein [Acuticoccus mangrovi]|uniref:HXXEE domain-containing protein n=1 Tax=Acuticoccus mangrovi TaxID=2796142 RepID=A0A934ID72_9HYPH|nr:HXXEE domain-containing protein [Acuticoccus mangrovi]MBJ3774393.1 HXXEE domain-containing protein [Acuticoccus mangrovi]
MTPSRPVPSAAPVAPLSRLQRLTAGWVYGGSLSGLVILALVPAIGAAWTLEQLLVVLSLPIYMIHQYEEHDDDRFRRFVNDTLAGGREVLTVADVFVINVFGVWAVLAVVILASFTLHPPCGVTAGYLLLVNGLLHVAQALALRRYNPGLVTGIVLFLPLGATILVTVGVDASLLEHLVALGLVVLLHLAIVARVASRRRRAPAT